MTLFREVKCPDPIHHASSPFHSVVLGRIAKAALYCIWAQANLLSPLCRRQQVRVLNTDIHFSSCDLWFNSHHTPRRQTRGCSWLLFAYPRRQRQHRVLTEMIYSRSQKSKFDQRSLRRAARVSPSSRLASFTSVVTYACSKFLLIL